MVTYFALYATKASGSDGLSVAKMLKGTAASIVPAVTLKLGKLPREWKHALITPIPKSNEMSTVNKYQPILSVQ